MSRAALIAKARAAAEAGMSETCTIKRDPTTVPDSTTGADVTVYTTTVYTGVCKVQDRDLSPRSAESGSSTADVLAKQLHVPASAGPFAAGDVVFMGEDAEPSWRVLADHEKSWQSARRLPVERVS